MQSNMSDYDDEYGLNQIVKTHFRILDQLLLDRILCAVHASLWQDSVAMNISMCKKLVVDDNGNEEVAKIMILNNNG